MSNLWLLFVLLKTNVLIKMLDADEMNEYREYATLISDVQKYLRVSSVFIAYPGSDENLETTTLMLYLMRQFSGNHVLSLALNYSSVGQRHHQGRIRRPLYVVLLNTAEHLERFRQVTSGCEMSYPFWLLIFTTPRPEICGPQAKVASNIFHLRFDTEMMVKCHGNASIMDWYAIDEDRTNIEELGTWDVNAGLMLKSNAVSVYERRCDLRGKLMRVAIVRESRLLELEGLAISGLFWMIFSELSERLNFTTEVAFRENVFGIYNESIGKWSGAIGRLHAEEVDFGVAEFSMTNERLNVVDFTLPIMVSRNQLYIKEPDGSYLQWASYFRVYDTDVWIVMELFYVFACLMVTLIRMKGQEKPLPPDHISENYLNVWGIFCQQGIPNFPAASAVRIAYFSILISSIFLLGTYSACLISYLTLNNPSLPFSEFEGFVADGSYKLITIRDSSDYRFFATSTNELLKKSMTMMADPKTLPRTTLEGFNQVCSGKVAFFATAAIKSQINKRITCDLVFVETGRIDSLGMTLRKNSPYTRLINYHLQKFRDMGILKRLRTKVYVEVNAVENKFSAVTLKGIMTILVILCSGALTSLIILTVEIMTHRFQVAKKKRKLSQSTTISEF